MAHYTLEFRSTAPNIIIDADDFFVQDNVLFFTRRVAPQSVVNVYAIGTSSVAHVERSDAVKSHDNAERATT